MIERRTTPYFAYGSNIPKFDMQGRCVGATGQRRAKLDGWALAFRGCADVEARENAIVEGAVWDVTDADLARLDRYEGCAPDPWADGGFYKRVWVEVQTDRGLERCIMYVMCERSLGRRGMPSEYYLGIIARGYHQLGIPDLALTTALEECCTRLGEANVSRLVPDGKKRWVDPRDLVSRPKRLSRRERKRLRKQRAAGTRTFAGEPADLPLGFVSVSELFDDQLEDRAVAKTLLMDEGMLEWEAEQKLEEIDEWADETGSWPTLADYLERGLKSSHVVVNRSEDLT